jgi:hypothetical protein
MKVVFVGPSLRTSLRPSALWNVEYRPPAAFGDLARAVLEGVSVIGLIDGLFEDRAAVWHKEILFALSEGVSVFGAASMGALRAAECARFGMIGVGDVFQRFADGELIDDDAVAQVHAPAELDYAALSEPLVNIEATCARLLAAGLISPLEAQTVADAARRCFFKDRSLAAVVNGAALPQARRADLRDLFFSYRHDVKAEDALELIKAVDAAPDVRGTRPTLWDFAQTQIWVRLLQDIRSEVAT